MSLHIETLDGDSGAWDRALAAMPARVRDIYFESAYALVWQRHGDGRAMGAIWEEPGARILYPFLMRDLADLPFAGGAGFHDITTPYGYGGPIADVESGDAGPMARFRSDFTAWCRANRVVSEFVRFHPMLDTQRGLADHLDVLPLGETVWCRVDEGAGDLVAAMDASHRRNLRKAQGAGLVAAVETTAEAYDRFSELYTATMDRRGAAEGYFFDDVYFRDFRELLGDRQALIGVRLGDEMIAGGLLMRSEHFAHYHLGGSSAAHLHLRPNNLFFLEAMSWARREGASALHVGGGYRPDDELLRFKRGLGSGRATFAIGRAVHLADEYDRLTTLHIARSGSISSGFFPAYRAPAAVADRP